MRIRFLDSVITEDGPISVGHVRDFPEELAHGFIKAGHAVRDVESVEQATAKPAPEVAVSRKTKGR
jgi:hypothetical protein